MRVQCYSWTLGEILSHPYEHKVLIFLTIIFFLYHIFDLNVTVSKY
jgi:hypothetical protein